VKGVEGSSEDSVPASKTPSNACTMLKRTKHEGLGIGMSDLADRAPSFSEVRNVRWYHSIELPGGVVTPGEYDLSSSVPKSLFPASLEGKRCLDVGTHDGFWAFEMEKRGASDVVGIDLDDPTQFDLRHPLPPVEIAREQVANRRHAFEIAHRARKSKVRRTIISVYDVSSDAIGTFDFAFIGTLLHHLRDPVGALLALRRVVTGELIVNGAFSVSKTLMFPRSPVGDLLPQQLPAFWNVPNIAALRRQVMAAGWDIARQGRPYLQRYGQGRARPPMSSLRLSSLPAQTMLRYGAPHVALLARPAVEVASRSEDEGELSHRLS
jgi:tRNA (mo5U34)-methyltransferase